MDNAVLWTLVGMQVLTMLVTIATVGRERKPVTSVDAVMTTIVCGVTIGLLLSVIF